jgi:hypothetical protein
MQKIYLRASVTKPGEKTWVGDTCIANMVAFAGEKRRGDRTSPEAFFDSQGIDAKNIRIHDEDVGLVTAIWLYANWDPKHKEESRLFNALSKHRQVGYGWKQREAQEERERGESAQGSEQATTQD